MGVVTVEAVNGRSYCGKPVMVFPLLCWQSSDVARFPVALQVSWETEAVVITDSDQKHYFIVTVNQS